MICGASGPGEKERKNERHKESEGKREKERQIERMRERIIKRFVALVVRGTSGHRDTAIDVTETLQYM